MTQQEDEVPALFDNTRDALVFALNANEAVTPRPFMNKAMAEGAEALRLKESRRRWKKLRKRATALGIEEPDALTLLALEKTPKPRKSTTRSRPLQGLDKAHAAGFILAQLATLAQEHHVVLRGLLTRAYDPCACRSACCSGWRRNLRWAEAVKETCYLLERVGDVVKEQGKRGLSTQPAMRLAFVEQFYTKNTMTVAAAAVIGKVSTITATRHRDWIFTYLEQTEQDAWQRVDRLFDECGITGSFD